MHCQQKVVKSPKINITRRYEEIRQEGSVSKVIDVEEREDESILETVLRRVKEEGEERKIDDEEARIKEDENNDY